MGQFSKISQERLATCHPQLVRLMTIVVQTYDIVIVYGFRTEEAQNRVFAEGKSRLKFPFSKHNKTLIDGTPYSEAVDAAPFNTKELPIDWNDAKSFIYLGGYILGVARGLDIPLRWGGDWDGDRNMRDQTLIDLPHFELIT
jgi:peptidoglycan L-alanyl-D-glutamate endopeptidase CwlK